ncbi:hypothetical protein G5V59_16025 [Nocardioides sp. W3-2-3]|nr:hypothetical protein [Nocardioides convexus]
MDTHSSSPPVVAGWREWVRLPGLGVAAVKAKLDTGARTSALHAFDLEPFELDGAEWVRFSVQPWQRSADDAVLVECPVHDRRVVRRLDRPHPGALRRAHRDRVCSAAPSPPSLTLSRRDEMGFRMLVGREALRQGFLVDPGRSYLGGRPPRRVRRKNRGVPPRGTA